MREQAAALFARLGVPLDPDRICRGLSIADQQLVEIAKALSFDARVIVMDEPTAALSAAEVARLFDVVRTLRAAGAAVLFISHRLEEVFEICQRVTVMRDGSTVLASRAGQGAHRRRPGARRWSAGDMPQRRRGPPSTAPRLTTPCCDVRAADPGGRVHRHLASRCGRARSSRSRGSSARAAARWRGPIFGIDRYDAGSVAVSGHAASQGFARPAAMAAGIGFVPEDRRQQGLVMEMSIQQNVALASLGSLRQGGLDPAAAERVLRRRLGAAAAAAVRPAHRPGFARLSGGNQQKVVLAKWLGRQPKLLIVDEPTRGIDIATKAEVHRLLLASWPATGSPS